MTDFVEATRMRQKVNKCTCKYTPGDDQWHGVEKIQKQWIWQTVQWNRVSTDRRGWHSIRKGGQVRPLEQVVFAPWWDEGRRESGKDLGREHSTHTGSRQDQHGHLKKSKGSFVHRKVIGRWMVEERYREADRSQAWWASVRNLILTQLNRGPWRDFTPWSDVQCKEIALASI